MNVDSIAEFFKIADSSMALKQEELHKKALSLFKEAKVESRSDFVHVEFQTAIPDAYSKIAKDWGQPYDMTLVSPPPLEKGDKPLKLDPKDNVFLWNTWWFERNGRTYLIAKDGERVKSVQVRFSVPLGGKYAFLDGKGHLARRRMPDAKSFVPVSTEIRIVEKALDAHLKKSFPKLAEKYATYYRQYAGVETATDGKIFFGNFMCSEPHAEWKSEWQRTLDGGDCYFNFVFQLKDSKFSDFTVNGEA